MKFLTAGVPSSAKSGSTLEGLERLARRGLDGMELEFVRSVRMSESLAAQVRARAAELGLALTAHAPYYINFNAKDPAVRAASRERLLAAARAGGAAGAQSIAFHPGFYLGAPAAIALAAVARELQLVRAALPKNSPRLAPELTGKPTQIGDLDEILALSRADGIQPCIDFAHLYARTGRYNGAREFHEVFTKIERALGAAALRRLHIHLAGVLRTEKGEQRHLMLEESELKWKELIRVMREKEVDGWLVCESPDPEPDALRLKTEWGRLG